MPTAAPSLAWAMGVHRTGDSGAYLELEGKGGGRKEKPGSRRPQNWGGERGEGACGKRSSSDSGLVFTPQPFPAPPKPQPLCERKLGFVVPVLPRDKEWECRGAGKSFGFSF